jgi:hypothetical protein
MGGGLLLPRSRSIAISVRQIRYEFAYGATLCGAHFCIPSGSQGGTTDTKICETAAFPPGMTSGVRGFRTARPYQPGTLEVSIDGLLWLAGRDFAETDPAAGTYTTFASLENAATIRTCYYPQVIGSN